MIGRGESVLKRKPCPSANLSTTNLTKTGLVSNTEASGVFLDSWNSL